MIQMSRAIQFALIMPSGDCPQDSVKTSTSVYLTMFAFVFVNIVRNGCFNLLVIFFSRCQAADRPWLHLCHQLQKPTNLGIFSCPETDRQMKKILRNTELELDNRTFAIYNCLHNNNQ